MRFRHQLLAAAPAVGLGFTIGHGVTLLDAPSPWPELTTLAVAVIAAHFLNGLLGALLTHRAAHRG